MIEKFRKLKENRTYTLPTDFDSIDQLTEIFLDIVKTEKYNLYLGQWLCDCVCKFPDEPLIWLFRSMLARKNNNPQIALHYIKQAFKFSGNSALFNEISAIYNQLGDERRSMLAKEQAKYKKHVEDTTCS